MSKVMGSQPPKSVRFEHSIAERSSTSDFHLNYGGYHKRTRLSPGAFFEGMKRRFDWGVEGFKSTKKHLSFKYAGDKLQKKSEFGKNVLDPQQPFLQKWNKIFVLSCVIAIAVDPLFFYIPVIDSKQKCLSWDRKLAIVACILRSFIDIFYVLHMIFEFRTGFVASSSLAFGRGDLNKDPADIAKRYMSSYFIIDLLSILPFPQIGVFAPKLLVKAPIPLQVKELVKIVILSQLVPRLLRIYPLFKEVTRTSGILTETAWSGAIFNLFIYMLASHVVGAIWYLLSVETEVRCWAEACSIYEIHQHHFYCNANHRSTVNHSIVKYCPHEEPKDDKDETFNFGIYSEALKFNITEIPRAPNKFFYCFWWALRNVGSSGQNLQTSTYGGELCFAVFIAILGLVLFALLISNIQKYLQSTTVRIEQMRLNRRDAEHWMAHRMLPEPLRQRIRQYGQYKWQLNRGVKEEELISNLPKDLRRDIQRHLCLALLTKVPLFKGMDKQLLDAMCEYLKPVLFTEKSCILQEGDPIDMMLFIMKGTLIATTTKAGFVYTSTLNDGEFCGEELVQWAMDPDSTLLPTSERKVESQTEVEAFALKASELRSACKLYFHHVEQLRHSVRFYSHQWRTREANKIQEAWHAYCDRKQKRGVLERSDRFQVALARTNGYLVSFGAALYGSIFVSHLLKTVQWKKRQNTQLLLTATLPSSSKPEEPGYRILDL